MTPIEAIGILLLITWLIYLSLVDRLIFEHFMIAMVIIASTITISTLFFKYLGFV